MMKRQNFLILVAAALLVSCSGDDTLTQEAGSGEGLKTITLTATLPADGMHARAEGDAAAVRCYVQMLSGDGSDLDDGGSVPQRMEQGADGTYTTIVTLDEDKTYDFLFYADTQPADGAEAPADLRQTAYTNGQTLAWAGTALDESWNEKGINATLKHIVTRVSLKTTTSLTVSSASPLAIEVPAVYAAYDVAAGKAVVGSEVAGGYTFRAASGYYRAGAEVGHFYVLGDGSNQKLALRYEDSTITIPEVPVSADTHITLSGRIYYPGITLIGGEITATVTEGWENENLEIEKK